MVLTFETLAATARNSLFRILFDFISIIFDLIQFHFLGLPLLLTGFHLWFQVHLQYQSLILTHPKIKDIISVTCLTLTSSFTLP